MYFLIIQNKFFIKFLNGFLIKKTMIFLFFDLVYLHYWVFVLSHSSILKITSLLDIFAIDLSLKRSNVLGLSYCFLNLKKSIRFFFKIFCSFFRIVPSLSNLFSSAN